MPQPSERLVETRGGKVKTRVLSAGEGEPLLYIHGAGGLLWDPFLDALAERFAVHAPEHPGSGESVGLEHLDDVWALALHYDDLLDEVGVERARVVGHSFGGMVAAELAANSPRRVERLALIAPVGLWRDDHPVPDVAGINPERLPAMLFADPEGPVARAFPRPAPDDPEALFRAGILMASINHFIWPLPDKGLEKRLYRVKAPTLLVWGRQDGLVDVSYADAFRALLADARVEVVDGAGHVPQLEQFETVTPLVVDFLTT